MKKKLVAATLTAAMILSTGLVTVPVMAKEDGEPYKAALLLNGTLGDKSFYDSANAGLEALQEELGDDKFTFKVEQMGATNFFFILWFLLFLIHARYSALQPCRYCLRFPEPVPPERFHGIYLSYRSPASQKPDGAVQRE